MSSTSPIGSKGVPRPQREEQILSVAVAQFAQRGYAGTSMVEIANAAGISKPLIYQYFGSKDGLYLTCLHAVGGGLLERLETAEDEVDASVTSRIHPIRAVLEALEPQRIAWRLLFDTTVPARGMIPGAANGYRTRMAALAASGSERFLAARGDRSELDVSALTAVWMGVVDSVISWWLQHPDETAAQMVARCGRLLAAVAE